jgi:glucose PTS system EIICBA or EIICB component
MKSKFFSVLQKIGQSLMVPVSVLPAAGLLVAAGRLLGGGDENGSLIGRILFSGGLAIFEQLPLVFAIGVAIGFTGGAGVAGLAAAVGYFTLINILKVISDAEKLSLALNTGVFGGIIVGLIAAQVYNRFYQIQLPRIFGFFSGKRFVPIMTTALCFVAALALGYVWPSIQNAIHEFGNMVIGSPFGPAFYAAGKRLLIPLGLHHVYYPSFLYEFGEFVTSTGKVIRGDSARYFAGDPTAGRFMASEFPIMLFGLPAAALAMYCAAPKEKRAAVGGIMLSAALTSIITGITEPIEFAFIFVAPLLYILHVAFAFLSGWLTALFDVHLGYTFSASLIDLGLGFFNAKNSAYMFLFVGPLMAVLYFFSFYGAIKFFNFLTPGREVEKADASVVKVKTSKTDKALYVLEALGGATNLTSLDACITRLRITVVDEKRVRVPRLKELGAAGVMHTGQNFQIIFGVESDLLKEEIKGLLNRVHVYAPTDGEITALSDVPDATFADKILGDGFAIRSTSGEMKAPSDGKIINVFPTKHALGMLTSDGLELLIHVGIDTVKMKGDGFTAWVKEGDEVHAGDKLISYDIDKVRAQAKSDISPIVITNMDRIKNLTIKKMGTVNSRDLILEAEINP